MSIRTGIIGYSEGNGHPFSFSAILNGYDDQKFGEAGWSVIHNYLRAQSPDRFGIGDARVTCAWTQDSDLTARLCAACKIDTACATLEEMTARVDAVIVARDDWQSHARIAMPFLEAGKFVFIDKPLSLDNHELAAFEPYLRAGKLMSCSGLRYAAELDAFRAPRSTWSIGTPKLVEASVLFGIEKYGIHMIEAVASLDPAWGTVTKVTRLPVSHDAWVMQFSDGVPFVLHCLGQVAKTFHVSIYGDKGHQHIDLHDNFSAFRRAMEKFFAMVASGRPSIDPDDTLRVMRLIQEAQVAPRP